MLKAVMVCSIRQITNLFVDRNLSGKIKKKQRYFSFFQLISSFETDGFNLSHVNLWKRWQYRDFFHFSVSKIPQQIKLKLSFSFFLGCSTFFWYLSDLVTWLCTQWTDWLLLQYFSWRCGKAGMLKKTKWFIVFKNSITLLNEALWKQFLGFITWIQNDYYI